MRGRLQGHSPDWKRTGTWTLKMEMDFKLNLKPNASDIFVNLYNYTHVVCCIAVKYKSCSHVKWIQYQQVIFLSVVLCRRIQKHRRKTSSGYFASLFFLCFIIFCIRQFSVSVLTTLDLYGLRLSVVAGSRPREQDSFYWISQRHLAITQYSSSCCSLTKGITQKICGLCFCPNK